MNYNHQHHRARRAQLIAEMRRQAGGGIAAIPTAPEAIRNADTYYPYRPDSYFYYVTGFPEPEAIVLLTAGANEGDSRQILFCRDKNVEREIWDGFRYGPDAAREIFGFDEAYSIGDFPAKFADLMADRPALYTPLGLYPHWDETVTVALNEVRHRVRTGIAVPETVVDVRAPLAVMRLYKDAQELPQIRRAADISSSAHRRAMERTRPGWFEYQVEAELAHEFLRSGAQAVAYPSIVASGPNACVLHYRDNNRQMQPSELLLIDAGCEVDGYASDITRTFPVGGRFSGPQKAIYELVLEAQLACIDAVKPGRAFHDYHQVAERVLAQGLIDLKLCTRYARRRSRIRSIQAVLYASGGALARTRRARCRPLPRSGRIAHARARHAADGRARLLHPSRRRRARAILGHRRAHRRRLAGDRVRQ